MATARPMPPSLTVHGSRDGSGDQDWFRIEPLDQPATLDVLATGAVTVLGVSDGTTELPVSVATNGDGQQYSVGPAPTGVPLYLHVLPAGDYTVTMLSGVPAPTGPAIPAPALAARLSLTLSDTSVAAYWDTGQHLTGTLTISDTGTTDEELTLDAVTSHYAWTPGIGRTSVVVSAGTSVDVPISVAILPDAWADLPVRISVRARDATGAQATAFAQITPGRASPPVAPYQAWSVPDALLGGLDVAALAIGGVPVPSIDPAQEARLYDGIEHRGGALIAYLQAQPVTLTSDLAGDAPVPVAGIVIDPIAPVGSTTTAPRIFTLQLSTDGATWETALTGEISPLPLDQSFVLPAPVPARFARLVIESTWGTVGIPFAISEWKVIAQPGVTPTVTPVDVADDSLGGHVVWATPPFAAQVDAQQMLRPDAAAPQVVFAPPGTVPSWVIGFQDDRAALLSELQWVDPAGSDPSARLKRVHVDISTGSPLGPWQAVGTWRLARAADGTVAPFPFATPTWTRFVRFTGTAIPKAGHGWEAPAVLRAMEVPTSDTYRSVIGEWGQGSPRGPHEWLAPPAVGLAPDSGEPNDTSATATPLAPDTTATGSAHHGSDVDYYALATAAGQNSLTFTVGGTPTLGVSLSLYDPSDTRVPMTFNAGKVPGTVVYAANVEPDTTYHVKVEQPSFSAVFAFDSSGSMTPYLPVIEQVKRAYLADRRQDDVPPKVIEFKDDRTQQALVQASQYLAGREGARAVLLITDMELAGYPDTQLMWQALATVQPLLFAELVGDLTPDNGDQVMQDLALTGHGPYDYVAWHANGDRAFDRMATWLRRPAGYSLSYAASHRSVPPPQPASLSVVSAPNADGTPSRPPIARNVAIDIILDTSGSMLTRFGKTRRIDAAKSVLTELVTQDLPVGAPVALRVFGDRAHPCATTLAIPFGPLDPAAVTSLVDGVAVYQQNDTPIGAALRSVPDDLASSSATRIVLLITDSQETWPNKDLCGLDPAVVVRELATGDTHVDVVGMAVTDKRARRTMRAWAKAGNGSYFDARDPAGLARSLVTALSAPYDVFDATGTKVAGGIVGGPAIQLLPGVYTVVVSTDPEVTFDAVVLGSGQAVTLTMPSPGG